METQLIVTAIEWERVNLTLHLTATRPDLETGTAEPLEPIAAELALPETAPRRRRFRNEPEPEAPVFGDDHVPSITRFYLQDKKRVYYIAPTHLGDGQYVLHLNVSNFEARQFLPNGTWKLFASTDDGEEIGATWDLADLAELDDLTRVFLFASNSTAYTVSFGITEDEVEPLLAIRSYIFDRAVNPPAPSLLRHPTKWLKRETSHAKLQGRKLQVVRAVYNQALKLDQAQRLMRRAAANPVKPRILFASEQRNGLEGNLLAVRDRMVERGLEADFDFRYSFRTRESAEKFTLMRMLKELAQADIVILDDYFAPLDWLEINPKAKYIQVWHAGSGFKSIGYSRFGKFGSPALSNAHRQYTYAITGSKHLKHAYAEAFGIEQEAIIPTGLPRIDKFLDPAEQAASMERVHTKFPGLKDKKVILFAPTFRGRGAREASYDYDKIDFQELYDFCGEDTVVAFRMHHFIPGQVPIPAHMRDRFIDVSSYREGNDLLLVSDIMITDYSSIIYEFSLLKRPMLFFAYDEQSYSAVRGFHRPYEETAPGKICHTFDELLTALRDEDFETERGDQFREENFDYIDTHASDRVIDWLILGEPPYEAVEASGEDNPSPAIAAFEDMDDLDEDDPVATASPTSLDSDAESSPLTD